MPENINCDLRSNLFSRNSGMVVILFFRYKGTNINAAIINGIPDIHSYTEFTIPVEYAAPDNPIIVELEIFEANKDNPINPQPKDLPPRKSSSPVFVFLAMNNPMQRTTTKYMITIAISMLEITEAILLIFLN